MSEIQDLEKRVESLEKKKTSPFSFFLQYLLSPALLLMIGFLLNLQIETTKQGFQKLELEVKRIEATQKFIQELFSGSPQRAFIAERLISQIVEEKLAKEISAIVKDYYKGSIDELISKKDIKKADEIKAAAETVQSLASKQLLQSLQEPSFLVIVASSSTEPEAIKKAKELLIRGYNSEVVFSDAGLYGVTIGRFSFEDANNKKSEAIKKGDAPPDAYLMNQKRVVKVVFPAK